jgi:hypothetical protein
MFVTASTSSKFAGSTREVLRGVARAADHADPSPVSEQIAWWIVSALREPAVAVVGAGYEMLMLTTLRS